MAVIVKNQDFKQKVDLKTKVDAPLRAPLPTRSSSVLSKEPLETQEQARQIIQEASEEAAVIRKEAKEILSQVQQELENAKQRGYEEGYKEGLEKNIDFLNQIYFLKEKWFEKLEPQILSLVMVIVEKVIAHQMKENDQVLLGIIRECISSVLGQKIIVKLHPSDYETISSRQQDLLRQLEAGRTLSFKQDESIRSGGCIVESEVGSIDAQIEVQLLAIKKALGLANS